MSEVFRVVCEATPRNWTARYALNECKRRFVGLTGESEFRLAINERDYPKEYECRMQWGSFDSSGYGRSKDRAAEKAAQALMLQIARYYGGESMAAELRSRFEEHAHQARNGGFPGALTVVCPYCSTKGYEDDKRQVREHIEVCHVKDSRVVDGLKKQALNDKALIDELRNELEQVKLERDEEVRQANLSIIELRWRLEQATEYRWRLQHWIVSGNTIPSIEVSRSEDEASVANKTV